MESCGLLPSTSASASASASTSVYRAPDGADGDAPGFQPVATATLGQVRLRMELEMVMEGGGGV